MRHPWLISTLAPREGSDRFWFVSFGAVQNFNPRSPRGERLQTDEARYIIERISTLAPREGSDCLFLPLLSFFTHFNPRSPRGERQRLDFLSGLPVHFNPRSPRGERRKL